MTVQRKHSGGRAEAQSGAVAVRIHSQGATPGSLASESVDTGGSPLVVGCEQRRQLEPLGWSVDEPDSRQPRDTALCMACVGIAGFAGHDRGGSPFGLCRVVGWGELKKGMQLGLWEPTFWRVRWTASPDTGAGLRALEEGLCPWLVPRPRLLGARTGPSTSLAGRAQGG